MKEGRTFQPIKCLPDPIPGHRQQERGTILHHLDQDASTSDQKIGAELLITRNTDNELRHHSFDHLFDQERLGEVRHLCQRHRHLVRAAETERDASAFRFVSNTQRFGHDREAQFFGGRNSRLRIANNC